MHPLLHSVAPRMILAGALFLALAEHVPCAFGQTNVEVDLLQPENLHTLGPLAGFVRSLFWFFGATLLVLVVVLTALRYRVVGKNLYKASNDKHWTADAKADAGDRVEADEVMGACAVLEHHSHPEAPTESPVKAEPAAHTRLFTPASGVAWEESMLMAFLSACMRVNCLGRTWREAAVRQVQVSNAPDPREAELIRRLMQRWQEFHVDPDEGVFLNHTTPNGRSRVCVVSVTKEKHTLSEAAFNAGFVIESVGRYLRNTDLVYRRELGDYHAPTQEELATMTPGEKDSLIRITEIPDPWQEMIAGLEPSRRGRAGAQPGGNCQVAGDSESP
jgi:hypothetical protein